MKTVRDDLAQFTGQIVRIVDPVEFESTAKFRELAETPLERLPSSTTPSVLNLTRLRFQNTSSTLVTNFLNGQEGQHIMVVGDGNTTIVHGTRIFNTAGTNITLVNGRVYSYLFDGSVWREQGGTPTPNLSFVATNLGAVVNLPNSATWYNVLSLSLSAGTWLISSHATFRDTHPGEVLYGCRISDGTNDFASGQVIAHNRNPNSDTISLTCLVNLALTTTVRLQAITDTGGSVVFVLPATATYPSGDTATIITAVRVA